MYRAALEGLLGFNVQGAALALNPCIPRGWPGFEIAFRHGRTLYEIAVQNPGGSGHGIARATLDGVDVEPKGLRIPLLDDGASHRVNVVLA
jgi:cyclic beta-1,2-glucan synthetase